MQQILFIAIGGSIGALTRFWLSKYISRSLKVIFPWGTLVINLTGSFLIGFFFALFDKAIIPPQWRSLITIGFLGAYTTFSTYSLETLNLLKTGEFKLGFLNIISSNLLGIILVFLGMESARILLKILNATS